MKFKHFASACILLTAPTWALSQSPGSGSVNFEFTRYTGPIAISLQADTFNSAAWINRGLVNEESSVSVSGWSSQGYGSNSNGYVIGSAPVYNTPGVALRYVTTVAGSAGENLISFTPRAFNNVLPGQDFVLGTLSFQNGFWFGGGANAAFNAPADLAFNLSTVSADGAQFNQSISGSIRLVVNAPDGLDYNTLVGQQAEADWLYIDSPALLAAPQALRVYDACCRPAGETSTASVDVIGRFGSLHIAGLANVQGGGFVTAAVTPLPVPEPGTWALLALGLAAVAARGRAGRVKHASDRAALG